ncbi:MAG TPA: trigger factor, partial [Patescibacteria group bacterium]|nr:trigger factor [Patescibacteria group bacterium]
MKHQIQKLPKSQTKIAVELHADEFEKYIQQTIEDARRNTSVRGFRPGKAPTDVIEKRLDKNHVLSDAGERALMESLNKIVREQNLETIGEPAVEIKKIARGSEFIFEAVITLLPQTTLGSWKNVKIVKKPVNVSDEEVEKVIESLRKERAAEAEVDRAGQKGDRVEVEYEMFVGGLRTEEGLQKGEKITLGENLFVPEFEQNVLGAKKGEKKIFTVAYKADHPQKRFAGKEVEFRVTVNGVYEVKLPAADDGWAKTVGQFESLEALKKVIRENLEGEKKTREDERVEGELIEAVVKETIFTEIPDLLVSSELEKMIDELKQSVAQQGMDFAKYMEMIKKTDEDLKKEFTPKAEKRVKSSLLLREIVKSQNMQTTDKEIQDELAIVKAEHQGHDRKELEYFDGIEFRRRMESILL